MYSFKQMVAREVKMEASTFAKHTVSQQVKRKRGLFFTTQGAAE
jgi:hypothetical protein